MPKPDAQERVTVVEPPLWRQFAAVVTPIALVMPRPIHRHMASDDWRAAKATNQRFLQRHMERYIDRSARLLLGSFIAFQVVVWLLPYPILVTAMGTLMLASILHMVLLLFWKQHLDNRFGRLEPPE